MSTTWTLDTGSSGIMRSKSTIRLPFLNEKKNQMMIVIKKFKRWLFHVFRIFDEPGNYYNKYGFTKSEKITISNTFIFSKKGIKHPQIHHQNTIKKVTQAKKELPQSIYFRHLTTCTSRLISHNVNVAI